MLSVTKLNFAARLKNKLFRRKFFRSSAREEVAQQIRELRRKLKMRQVDLAKAAHMKQSAVSRIEQADYSRWSFNTILRIADSLDARVRVLFEPADQVIAEYERREVERAELARRFESEFRQVPASLPDEQLGSAQGIAPSVGTQKRRALADSLPSTGQSRPGATTATSPQDTSGSLQI